MTKKFKATEEQFRKALLKWLNRQHQQLRANVHGDDDTSQWCKDEADLVEQHIQTVESLIFVNDALKVSADEAHRQADLAYERIEELEAKLSEQIEWVKSLADDLIAAEGREARLKEKLAKAVEWAEKVREYAISWDDKYLSERSNEILAELTSSEAANGEAKGGKDE